MDIGSADAEIETVILWDALCVQKTKVSRSPPCWNWLREEEEEARPWMCSMDGVKDESKMSWPELQEAVQEKDVWRNAIVNEPDVGHDLTEPDNEI